jgi:AcrR family transcriptional regulator
MEEGVGTSSLRERNRSERREALLDAAYALFRERGFAATTMDDIADRAGLSRRTAFRYFASKDELVFPQRDARLAMLRAELEGGRGEPRAFDAVRRACLAVARDYARDRERMLAQWRVVQSEPALIGRELQLDRAFEDAIEAAFVAEGGTARARRRARVRAAAIVGAVRATLREWLEGGASADLVRLGRETFGELERGLASREE